MTNSVSDPPPSRLDPLRPVSCATDITESSIEPDSDDRPDDDDFYSDTQSITPSIFEHQVKYGRTYHSFRAGAYPFPNDAPELERLDLQHAIIKTLFNNKNWFAPLRKPKRMMDIGCGTGKWCVEMAKEFPNTRVEGIDLSPVQIRTHPENCDFYIDDITRPGWWTCHGTPYDYIHTRMLLGIFSDFREIIQKSYNNLVPGGWMESQEIYSKPFCTDKAKLADSPLLEWTNLEDKAAMQLGRPLRIANKLKRWYEQAGFVDVHEEIFRIPINSWAKDPRFKMLGKFFNLNMNAGVYAWTVEYFVSALQWTPLEVEVYLAQLRNSMADKSLHAYYKIHVVWGRKPLPGEPMPESGTEGEEGGRAVKPANWPKPEGQSSLEDEEQDPPVESMGNLGL